MHHHMLIHSVIAICFVACSKPKPITSTFSDNFERDEIGSNYRDTSDAAYRIVNGKLRAKGAYNKPLWLRRPIPPNAVIELDVQSDSPAGDIKVEVWGDGKTHAMDKGAYMASSYVFVFGGWNNRKSAIFRLDEHDPNTRSKKPHLRVVRGRNYHWKIERRGAKISWWMDGQLFLEHVDSLPLKGEHHSYFAFNNWQSDLTFDNLRITALQ